MRIIPGAGLMLAVAALAGAPAGAQTAGTVPTYQGGPLGVMQGGTGEVNQHFTGSYHYSTGGGATGQTMVVPSRSNPASATEDMPAWMTNNGAGGDGAGGATPFTGWVFEEGRGGDSGAGAFSQSMRQVDAITRDATRLMDGAAGAADSADRFGGQSMEMGAGGMQMGRGGVVIEDRGNSSATVTVDGPNGRMMRTE